MDDNPVSARLRTSESLVGQPMEVVVHQLLHGYDQGHRLIAASTKLPSTAQRVLLALSDASGPQPPSGFEQCLTGYPVPDTEWFAFASTWPAPEMHRPGCVWTHTLLIHVADLAHIRALPRLASLFSRPSISLPDRAAYREPLRVPVQPPGLRQSSTIPKQIGATVGDIALAFPREALVGRVLEGLYGPASDQNAPVLVIADEPTLLANLVLAVWDQQWARMRREFSFCTAAVTPRHIAGQPLTLQILPRAALRLAQRDVPGAHVILADQPAGGHDAGHVCPTPEQQGGGSTLPGVPGAMGKGADRTVWDAAQIDGPQARWLTLVARDLIAGSALSRSSTERGPRGGAVATPESGSGLRAFLARFAPELHSTPRVSMRFLATLYAQIEAASEAARLNFPAMLFFPDNTMRDVLDSIADVLPSPRDGSRLKRAIFGGAIDIAGVPRLAETYVLAALSSSADAARMLDAGDLNLRDRAANLWDADGGFSAKYLIYAIEKRAEQITQLGEEVIAGLAGGVPEEDALRIAVGAPRFVFDVIRQRPWIAAEPDVWRADPLIRHGAITALEEARVQANGLTGASADTAEWVTLVDAVVAATLNAKTSVDEVKALVHALGPSAIRLYLDHASHTGHQLSLEEWSETLRAHTELCRAWLENTRSGTGERIAGLAALACSLRPEDVRGIPSTVWMDMVRKLTSQDASGTPSRLLSPDERLAALAFALIVALQDQSGRAAESVALTFPALHAATVAGKLPSSVQRMLSSFLPAAPAEREWDIGWRLRTALVAAFQLPGSDMVWFLRALGDDEALRHAVGECTGTGTGRRIVKAARDAIRAGASATPLQRKLFEEASHKSPSPSLADLLGRIFE